MAGPEKKIVLFADGTGNSSASPQKTNVWRTYRALDVRPGSGQVVFYDNGVGTSSFRPLAILGQVFGFGLARNVKQIYGFLCRNYKIGDEIYAFGFSRGAFTMRVVVGLITSQGIIDVNQAKDDADLDRLISSAYRKFRQDAFAASFWSFIWDKLRNNLWEWKKDKWTYDPQYNQRRVALAGEKRLITFVGLWDTVDAYGLPVDELTRAWSMVIWPLTANDRNLSDRVERACQALSLDEQRLSFEPMLWNEKPGGEAIEEKRLCQVWFAGVHANVGGGYPDDTLSFVPLNWMFEEAQKAGLTFLKTEREFYREHSNVNGPLYDNRAGVGNLYRYAPRQLEQLFDEVSPNLLTSLLTWCCPDIRTGKRGWMARIFPFFCVQEKKPDSLFWKFLGFFGVKGLQFNRVEIDNPKIHHSVFERIESGCCSYAPINLPADYVVIGRDGKPQQKKGPELTKTTPQENLAPQRRERQQYVWNRVWARKVLYYITLAVISVFVVYPYLPDWLSKAGPPENIGENAVGVVASLWESTVSFFEALLGGISNVIRLIPTYLGKLPGFGFASGWAAKYGDYQIAFLFFTVIIAGLLLVSARLNARLKSEMSSIWRSVFDRGEMPEARISAGRKKLAAFLTGKFNKGFEKLLTRLVEIFAVAVFLVLLFLSVINHTVLSGLDLVGGICKRLGPNIVLQSGGERKIEFFADESCRNTSLRLIKNRQYEISFKIKGGTTPLQWRDGAESPIVANVNGWQSAPWFYYLATPFRRHWFANWFQPIARIDDKLFDIFPLKNDDPASDDPTTIVMQLEAKRSGDLYLYLNDAVIFSPSFVKQFYANNSGSADVTITDVTK